MAALVVMCSVSSYLRFRPLAKLGDYRDVAAYLEAHEAPNEPIVIAVSHTEYPLRVYYDGVNPLVPVPVHDPLKTYDVPTWSIQNQQQVLDALSDIASGQSIWVFTDRGPDATFAGYKLNLDILEAVLADGFKLESEQDFYMAKVRKYRRE
jgi:hypothetical protein